MRVHINLFNTSPAYTLIGKRGRNSKLICHAYAICEHAAEQMHWTFQYEYGTWGFDLGLGVVVTVCVDRGSCLGPLPSLHWRGNVGMKWGSEGGQDGGISASRQLFVVNIGPFCLSDSVGMFWPRLYPHLIFCHIPRCLSVVWRVVLINWSCNILRIR